MKKSLFTAAIFSVVAAASAQADVPSFGKKSASDILNSGSIAEDIGKMIAAEGDYRDNGFGDTEVTLHMTLRNAQGQENKRSMRQQVFEMADTSIGDKSINIFDNPRDVAGTAFLTHTKILDPDDQWLYLPALKRVKRISSKNKSGPFVGSEFAYEDLASQEVEKYTYKYIKTENCPTDTSIQCFVVERFPEYDNSGYTKQIVWADQTEFRVQQIDFYDRKESLLKTLSYHDYKQYLGQYWRAQQLKMVNHQNKKSTDLQFSEFNFKQGLKDSDFTESRLRRVR